jgi:hypothetical protein
VVNTLLIMKWVFLYFLMFGSFSIVGGCSGRMDVH